MVSPRRRLTLRRMMATTMLLGLLIGGGIELSRWPRRSAQRRSSAERHHGYSEFFGGRPEAVAYWTKRWSDQMGEGFPAGEYLKEVVAYHDRMRIRWERAAGRPWATVEPDPPAPNIIDFWEAHRPR